VFDITVRVFITEKHNLLINPHAVECLPELT